ncbi:GIY-YIG nuclease family protein [Paracoccus sp. TOH]|uniref:GIY-YIG nuclease family protein n=1 Tax=Paracoccus sp. TOH TaxID=1263728 RepID=UPI0025AF2179|nr:GIY-YIG nuclease family protein [Paracoccus sp. TOH]WJS86304.1 GIY-YIG nuclease family protein [Paracoccus sp. TOH]
MPAIDLPIPEAWHDLAHQKGMTIIARVQDRYHLALACGTCGRPSKHKISALRACQPQCPHCLEAQWRAAAEQAGLEYLRRDPEDMMYAWYRAPCGHEVRRQPDRMRQIGAGRNGLRCETCHAAREAAEAESCGWVLIGSDPEGDANYRLYQHGCGHQQRIARGNLQTGRFSCGCCGECWSAAPSWLYLLRLHLPGHGPVVKLGYSRNPQSRMRHQLGMTAELGCALVVSIPMATGHDALKMEKRLHRKLRRRYPEAVLPREAIARHLNLVSEIYDAALEPVIRTELERIARTPAS